MQNILTFFENNLRLYEGTQGVHERRLAVTKTKAAKGCPITLNP